MTSRFCNDVGTWETHGHPHLWTPRGRAACPARDLTGPRAGACGDGSVRAGQGIGPRDRGGRGEGRDGRGAHARPHPHRRGRRCQVSVQGSSTPRFSRMVAPLPPRSKHAPSPLLERASSPSKTIFFPHEQSRERCRALCVAGVGGCGRGHGVWASRMGRVPG